MGKWWRKCKEKGERMSIERMKSEEMSLRR
jgi:hypothetical protein